MTPEGKVRSKVVRWAKVHGIGHVRMSFRPGVKVGVPDDLFLLPNGWSLWIEFKAPGKYPSPIQAAKIKSLSTLRHEAGWTDDPVEAINWLEMMLLREPKRR